MVFKFFSEGFSPGSVVTVKGYVHTAPDRFEINLQCGPNVPPDIVGDIALHFNPRFDEDIPVIVRNTKTNGRWGYEEREGGFFFSPGQHVCIQIYSESRGYKIVVDDFPFIYYKHRQDLSAVSHMFVRGDIEVEEVYYKPTARIQEELYVPKPPGPYKFELRRGLKPGYSIEINGKTRGDVSRFSVNMVYGKNQEEEKELCCPVTVALHYDVRFYPSQLIVRNTMIDGEWGDEETDECFGFLRECEFCLRFDCRQEQYQIFVNNVLTSSYKHRISPQNISYIYIHGEINISGVFLVELQQKLVGTSCARIESS